MYDTLVVSTQNPALVGQTVYFALLVHDPATDTTSAVVVAVLGRVTGLYTPLTHTLTAPFSPAMDSVREYRLTVREIQSAARVPITSAASTVHGVRVQLVGNTHSVA